MVNVDIRPTTRWTWKRMQLLCSWFVMSIQHLNQKTNELVYILWQCNYLVDKDAIFPPYLWVRVTIVTYQAKEQQMPLGHISLNIGKYFYPSHLNIYVFYEVLKIIQFKHT